MNLVRLTSTPLHTLLRTLPSFTTSLHVRQLASMAPPTPAPASAPRRPDALHAGEAITVPSLSASMMILAPSEERTADGYDYRVLLLKRNAKSSTFVSAHVFPGGNMDPIDVSKEWDAYYPDSAGLSVEEKRFRSLQICACRETFEECGILLLEGGGEEVWRGVGEAERRVWRDKVHDTGTAFLNLFKMLGAGSRPGISLLQYRANWITPRTMKRRFDTHFFITVLPPSIPAPLPSTGASTAGTVSTPIVSSDGQETVSADWLTPSSAMSRTLQHTRQLQGSDAREDLPSLILFPPQFYLLAELASTKSYASLLIPGTAIVQPRSVVSFEPQLKPVLTSTGEERPATVLPGDPAHSQTAKLYPSASPSARHRTYVLLPSKEKGKGPPLGLTVMGIERLGLEGVLGAKGEWSDLIEGDVGVKTGPKL